MCKRQEEKHEGGGEGELKQWNMQEIGAFRRRYEREMKEGRHESERREEKG